MIFTEVLLGAQIVVVTGTKSSSQKTAFLKSFHSQRFDCTLFLAKQFGNVDRHIQITGFLHFWLLYLIQPWFPLSKNEY